MIPDSVAPRLRAERNLLRINCAHVTSAVCCRPVAFGRWPLAEQVRATTQQQARFVSVSLSILLGTSQAIRHRARARRQARNGQEPTEPAAANGQSSVLVVGGSGRVGGSTARWLAKLCREEGLPDVHIAVSGREQSKHDALADRWSERAGSLPVPEFVPIDLRKPDSVEAALSKGWDLVVHTAGPFQGVEQPTLLEACINAGIPYVDVCDDTALCGTAKKLSHQARDAGVPAIVSAGIWPGASALLAAEAVDRLGGAADKLELSFFTAGTGGAGPTIVSATFLLLAEPPLVMVNGQPAREEPWTSRRAVDFGKGAGKQFVHLLDEPEVYTCGEVLGVPNIRSSFGTSPDIWNYLFGAVKILPTDVLRNRGLMQAVANFSMPIISAVDQLVGATNAMRIDATAADGREVTLRVIHSDLEDCVGLATAAFGMEVLLSKVPDGVWFPVEMKDNRDAILTRVKQTATLWEV